MLSKSREKMGLKAEKNCHFGKLWAHQGLIKPCCFSVSKLYLVTWLINGVRTINNCKKIKCSVLGV